MKGYGNWEENIQNRTRRSSIDQRAQEILEKHRYNPKIPDAAEIESKKSTFEATYAELLEGISLPKKVQDDSKQKVKHDPDFEDFPSSPLESTMGGDSFEISANDLEVGAFAAQRMKEKSAERRRRMSIDQPFQSQNREATLAITKSATPETRTTRSARNAIDGMHLSALSSIHRSKANSIDVERKSDFARFGSPEVSDGEFYKMLDTSDLDAIRGRDSASIDNFTVNREAKPTKRFAMTEEVDNLSHFSLPQPSPAQSQQDESYQPERSRDEEGDHRLQQSDDYERDDYDDDFEDEPSTKQLPSKAIIPAKPSNVTATPAATTAPKKEASPPELSAVDEIMKRWNSDLPTLMTTMGATSGTNAPTTGGSLLPNQMISSTATDSIDGLYQKFSNTNEQSLEDGDRTDEHSFDARMSMNDLPQRESISLPQYVYRGNDRDDDDDNDNSHHDEYKDEYQDTENSYSHQQEYTDDRYDDDAKEEKGNNFDDLSSPIPVSKDLGDTNNTYDEDYSEQNLYEDDFSADSPEHRKPVRQYEDEDTSKQLYNVSPVITPPPVSSSAAMMVKPIESITSLPSYPESTSMSLPSLPSYNEVTTSKPPLVKTTFTSSNPTEKIMTFESIDFEPPKKVPTSSSQPSSRFGSKANSPSDEQKKEDFPSRNRSITPSPVVIGLENTFADTAVILTKPLDSKSIKGAKLNHASTTATSRSGRYSTTYYDEGEDDNEIPHDEDKESQHSQSSHSTQQSEQSQKPPKQQRTENNKSDKDLRPKTLVSRIPNTAVTKVKKGSHIPVPNNKKDSTTKRSKSPSGTMVDGGAGVSDSNRVTENTSKINNKLDYMQSMLSTLKDKRGRRVPNGRPITPSGPPRFTQPTAASSAPTVSDSKVLTLVIRSRDKSPRTSLTTHGHTLSSSVSPKRQSHSARSPNRTNLSVMSGGSRYEENPINDKVDQVLMQLSQEASHLLDQERKIDIKSEELILREKYVKQKELRYDVLEKQYLTVQQEKNELMGELLSWKKKCSQQEITIEQLKTSLLNYQIKYPNVSMAVIPTGAGGNTAPSMDSVLPARASQVLLSHVLQHPPTTVMINKEGIKGKEEATKKSTSEQQAVTSIIQLQKAEYEELLKQINSQESLLTAYQHENEKLLDNLKQQEYEMQCKHAILYDQQEQLIREVNQLRNINHISPDHGYGNRFQNGAFGTGIGTGIRHSNMNFNPSENNTQPNPTDTNLTDQPGSDMNGIFPQYQSQKKLHNQLQLELAYDTKIQHLEETIHQLKEEKIQQKQSLQKQITGLQHQLIAYGEEIRGLKETPIPKLQQQIANQRGEKEQLEIKLAWYVENQSQLPKVLQQHEQNQVIITFLKEILGQQLNYSEEDIEDFIDEKLRDDRKRGGGNNNNHSFYSTSTSPARSKTGLGYNKYQELYKNASKKIKELERTISSLRDSLHKRYPDSISNLIHTSALSGHHQTHDTIQKMQKRIQELSEQLQDEEEQHQTRLHSLRIEYDQYQTHSQQVIQSLQQQIESMAKGPSGKGGSGKKASSSSALADISEDGEEWDPMLLGGELKSKGKGSHSVLTLGDAKGKIRELEETIERVRGFYLKKIEDMKRKHENQLRSLKRTNGISDTSNIPAATVSPSLMFSTPTKNTTTITSNEPITKDKTLLAEYQQQIEQLQEESKELEKQNSSLKSTIQEMMHSPPSTPIIDDDTRKQSNDDDTPPPPPPVPQAMMFGSPTKLSSLSSGKINAVMKKESFSAKQQASSPSSSSPPGTPMIAKKIMDEELQKLRDHYEKLLSNTINQLTQQYSTTITQLQQQYQQQLQQQSILMPPPSPSSYDMNATWLQEKQQLLDTLSKAQERIGALNQEVVTLRQTSATVSVSNPAQSMKAAKYQQLEEQILHIERRFQLREQELQGIVENMKATFMLEKSRLLSMHQQELQIKDDKLLQFQQELEELIRHLHQLKMQQSQAHHNQTILNVTNHDTNHILRTVVTSPSTSIF